MNAQDIKFAVISAATIADHAIVAAVPGKSIRVINYTLVSTGANSCTWKSATTAISGAMAFPANGGASPPGTPQSPLMQTARGVALNLALSAALQVSGHLAYVEVT